MKNFFLRAAHWQIFFLIAAFYIADWFIPASLVGAAPVPARSVPISKLLAIQGMSVIVLGILLAWLWALGSFLYFLVRPPLRLSLAFFRFALLFPLVYGFAFPFLARSQGVLNPYQIFAHLFAIICMVYDFRFVAKILALQKEARFVTFRDYYADFFLLWFFPIGIWSIQPKINRMYLVKGAGQDLETAMLKSRS